MAETRFSKLRREIVLEKYLPAANPPVRLVKGARIRFAPGQPSGLHRHPVSTCGVVTHGCFIFQVEGEAERQLKSGDGFFEPAGGAILRFDNASQSEPAEIVCFYLADAPDTPAIEMLEGGMDAQIGKTIRARTNAGSAIRPERSPRQSANLRIPESGYMYTSQRYPFMAYSIKDPATDSVIRELAKVKGKPILDSIREACLNELARERRKVPLWDRLQPLLDQVAKAPKTRRKADKKFFDELSGDA